MNEEGLKTKSVKGIMWTLIDILSNQGFKFVIQIILARLLTPEDFGLIGMVTVFIAVSQSLVDSGFQNALIREDRISEEDLSTVFIFNLISSIFLYIVLFIFAPTISVFYRTEKLVNILRVLGVVVIINSLGIIQRTILIRQLDFRSQTAINVISTIISGGCAVGLAFCGFGVWSLVFQNILMQGIQCFLLTLKNRWIPQTSFSMKSFKHLFSFGWKLTVSGLINTLYDNSYFIIIGKFFSTTTLGYYTNAQKLRDVVSQSITAAVQRVSYPVLSKIQSENDTLKYGYKKIIKLSIYITAPFLFGLIAIAGDLIPAIFGIKWMKTVPYFQILCLAGVLYPLHAINLNILQVKGRSDLFLGLEIVKKIIGVTAILVVIIMRGNVLSLVWTTVFTSVISFFINSYYSAELLSYSTLNQVKDISKTILISVLMFLIVYFIPLEYLGVSIFLRSIIRIILGIISYVALSILFKLEEFFELVQITNQIIKKIDNFSDLNKSLIQTTSISIKLTIPRNMLEINNI